VIRLLGAFCGLCAVIALVVAAGDAYVDRRHQRCPVVSAEVKSEDIRIDHPFRSDGGGTTYQLVLWVVTATGESRTIRISSLRDAHGYDDWINRHGVGTPLRVRIDPANARYAELVDADGLTLPRHWREDLILAAIGAGLCIALWLIPARRAR